MNALGNIPDPRPRNTPDLAESQPSMIASSFPAVIVKNEVCAQRASLERFPMAVAIDGGSGTLKADFAYQLAATYGAICVDTGELYRSIALIVAKVNKGAQAIPEDRIEEQGDIVASRLELIYPAPPYAKDKPIVPHVQYRSQNNKVVDMSYAFRSVKKESTLALIDRYAAQLSKSESVRKRLLLLLQQHIGKSCIVAGLDIGSTVLPDADVKLLITADSQKRASWLYQERSADMESGTRDPDSLLAKVQQEIAERDALDTSRTFSPLIVPEQADVFGYEHIDMSDLTKDEALQVMSSIIDAVLITRLDQSQDSEDDL